VNKLTGNELLILSKNPNEFITYLEDNHNNIHNYILKSFFNVLQSNYNITQQQEKINRLLEITKLKQVKLSVLLYQADISGLISDIR